jgi:hypothetical protein
MMREICVICVICGPSRTRSPPKGVAFAQGIGGVRSSHGVAGAGARERGAPQSPVFGAAENAPKTMFVRSLDSLPEIAYLEKEVCVVCSTAGLRDA